MESVIVDVGGVEFPEFSGLRIMMMPFRLESAATVPRFCELWRHAIERLCELAPAKSGTAYLTIDEAVIEDGKTHRRPGLHVDGVGGAWGGSPGKYAGSGMLVAASKYGCRGWRGQFSGAPSANGECEHLRVQCAPEAAVAMAPGRVYLCGAFAVHESVPPGPGPRQFVRLSQPSSAPWYDGHTSNPLGIRPEGPVLPPRTGFMAYRATP